MHGAEAHRKGGKIADAIDEPERQDEPGIVPLEPVQRGIDPGAEPRKAVQQRHAELTAEPEITLVAAETPEPRAAEQQERVEQALRRGNASKKNDRLAFEKGPEEGNAIKTGAVMGDEFVDMHQPPLFTSRGGRKRRGGADVCRSCRNVGHAMKFVMLGRAQSAFPRSGSGRRPAQCSPLRRVNAPGLRRALTVLRLT